MTASKLTLSLLFFVLTMSSPPISSAAARRPCPGGSCPSPPSLEDARFFPHRRPLAVPLAGRRASHPPATARRPLHRETLTASRVADLLDAGCIVGSPMRTIAAYSVSDDQAHIEVINGVEHDDAVRGLCCHDKIAFIAEVDFEGVKELDFSLPPSLQWWPPLKMGCLSVTRWRRLHAAKEVVSPWLQRCLFAYTDKSALYTVEFQKRGMPLAHMLTWLYHHRGCPDHHLDALPRYASAEFSNGIVSAELPEQSDKEEEKNFVSVS